MEVLSGTEISSHVIQLIESSRKLLVLVTPYFDPWDRLSTAIKAARTQHGVQVRLLLRGGEDQAKQEEKARELMSFGVEVDFLKRLHAKVYLSESKAMVTSMNLLKSSALDSWEIALCADSGRDAVIFADIARQTADLLKRARADGLIAAHPKVASAVEEVASLLGQAPAARPTSPLATKTVPVAAKAAAPAAKAPPPAASSRPATRKQVVEGHCIRCDETIPLDRDHPYCASCYKSWVKYKNPDYEEKYCHSCGKKKETTMAKPLCRPCWEAAA